MNSRTILTLFVFFSMLILKSESIEAQTRGNLVIVGGALSDNNVEIYQKFIELAGGTDTCFISIIPSASGCPISSGEALKNNLIKYGVKPENIFIVPIAVVDCDETKDIDESEWIENANNQKLAEIVGRSTAIWFSGGDQSRITKALRNADGSNSLVINAIYQTFSNGAVIGGTSAGAAIMSPIMITGGVSIAALRYGITDKYIVDEHKDNGPVTIAQGLGFFPYGIVDQHFDKRHRLGRLIVATALNTKGHSFGYGIDENTAMVYYAKTNEIECIGAGGITIVDLSRARIRKSRYNLYSDILISYIQKHDRYNITTGEFKINPLKRPTNGNEYYAINNTNASGILSPQSGIFTDLISHRLIDNKAVNSIVTYCIDDDNFGLKITFSKNPRTKGYWTDKITDADNYSFLYVSANIEPVKISIKPLR